MELRVNSFFQGSFLHFENHQKYTHLSVKLLEQKYHFTRYVFFTRILENTETKFSREIIDSFLKVTVIKAVENLQNGEDIYKLYI